MTGYCYNEQEPKERCPYCGALCCADFVDVGVGYVQCGPYHCESCLASQIGPSDTRELSPEEESCGWYKPNSTPSELANVDSNGRIIRYFEADTLYRQSCGVDPRYDKHGNLKSSPNKYKTCKIY